MTDDYKLFSILRKQVKQLQGQCEKTKNSVLNVVHHDTVTDRHSVCNPFADYFASYISPQIEKL